MQVIALKTFLSDICCLLTGQQNSIATNIDFFFVNNQNVVRLLYLFYTEEKNDGVLHSLPVFRSAALLRHDTRRWILFRSGNVVSGKTQQGKES